MDELIEGDLPDDDPDVVAGMQRLARLRAAEAEIPDLWPTLGA